MLTRLGAGVVVGALLAGCNGGPGSPLSQRTSPSRSTSATSPPAPHRPDRHRARRYVSGIQAVSAPASQPMVCADRDLLSVKPGRPVRLVVRLGDAVATMTGVVKPAGRIQPIARLDQPIVTTRIGVGARWQYRVRGPSGDRSSSPLLEPVLGRSRSGYLCLVGFGSGTPPVAVASSTYGCMQGCWSPEFFATDIHRRAELDFTTPGYSIDTSIGQPVVIATDRRFYGRFTSLAAARTPLRVFAFGGARPIDVTRNYPAHLRTDAAAQWHIYERGKHPFFPDALGALASWVADEYTLGNGASAWATVERIRAEHPLRVQGLRHATPFLVRMRRLLAAAGYLR